MGADPRGIGSARAVPCVGDPDTWEDAWFTCAAEGDLSHLALVPAGLVADVKAAGLCEDEPILVHVTVCKKHARAVRKWLQKRTPEAIDTWPTATVLEHWGQINADMQDTPVLRMVRTA